MPIPYEHEVRYFEALGEIYKKMKESGLEPSTRHSEMGEVVDIIDDHNALLGRSYPLIIQLEVKDREGQRFMIEYCKDDDRTPGQATLKYYASRVLDAWLPI